MGLVGGVDVMRGWRLTAGCRDWKRSLGQKGTIVGDSENMAGPDD